MSSINFININKNINTDNRPVEGPKPFLEDIYSARLLKNVYIAGTKFAIVKNFVLGEFDHYSVEHLRSANHWREDYISKDINKCVEYLKELNDILTPSVEEVIENFPKQRKQLRKYHEMKKRAYPNE